MAAEATPQGLAHPVLERDIVLQFEVVKSVGQELGVKVFVVPTQRPQPAGLAGEQEASAEGEFVDILFGGTVAAADAPGAER